MLDQQHMQLLDIKSEGLGGERVWTACRNLAFDRSNPWTFEPRLTGVDISLAGPAKVWMSSPYGGIVGPYVQSNLTGGR
jgi:hypothetical protein